ncbi:MAG: hypothetical protein BWK80_50825 [Desulfobacteraceae bacterium IS3]|nr:MAG: hypothetical protein BWK80_50825 [Desulfobacteraceae bacterium IS3]
MWDIEEIPDENKVFYRIHKGFLREGKLIPGAFREIGDGMSVDWEKYSTPEDSICRAKIPEDNGIVSLIVGNIRKTDLEVSHKPSEKNISHSIVKGKKRKIQDDPEVRLILMKISQWEIQVGAYKY